MSLYKNKQWLKNQYIIERKSMPQIEKEYNHHEGSTRYWLKKFNIPTRSVSEARKGMKRIPFSEEHKRKISDTLKRRVLTEEHKIKIGDARRGAKHSKKIRKKMSENHADIIGNKNPFYGKTHSEETKKKMSIIHLGKNLSEEHRKKISASLTGENNPNWNGGISFGHYCKKFDFKLKEKIRNRDNRICVLCGKSEILNGRRLSVHHIDGDKMQGCNGKKWYLCTLCISCNSRVDTAEKEFLIVSNIDRG